MTHRILPGDRLVAAYNALLAVVWAVNWSAADHAPWIALAHAAAAVLPRLLARAPRRAWGMSEAMREIYPLVFLLAFWPELDLLRQVLGLYGFDDAIGRLDRAVFGVHLHAVWMPRLDAVWFSELMFFAYYAYYPLIFLPPLVVAIQGRRAALRDMTFRLMAIYLSCYVVYIAFPVYGPHLLWHPHQGPHTEGVFYQLVAAAQAMGDSLGCSFPSSHVAGAVTIAFLGWRWFSRPVAAVLTLEALGVALSTIYTQNHYGIDSVAGVIWALALLGVVVPGLERALGRVREFQPPPILPAFARAQPNARPQGGGP